MKIIRSLVLYISLGLGANGALADIADIAALRTGDMKKLNLHSTPKEVSTKSFEHELGGEATLADFKGKFILLNFWATWCGPCRQEMPGLSALQAEMGGHDFKVVTLATGHNPPAAMKKFFAEIEVENLPFHRDPKKKVANDMRIFGLPITIIIDREGREIGRLTGEADWNSDNAREILQALIDRGQSG